ncbi:hypothetical protein DPMN_065533 [Dreissena polymorpha]|uniref:C1q domain-containing protein n=1 Tax=Dreissena polymorpha TaxID=45954 RepID=A0A9D3YSD0_DREPO|nr:hypothetical protein DPMN_065533 [Dreissena polymorpha]
MNGEAHDAIVHNGNVVAIIYGHGDNVRHDQGSQTVIINMITGDDVAVKNIDFADDSILGDFYSSFSGYIFKL